LGGKHRGDASSGVKLNPDKNETFKPKAGDSLIVLAG
jgi:hypothetical protein